MPSKITGLNRFLPTMSHWKCGLVADAVRQHADADEDDGRRAPSVRDGVAARSSSHPAAAASGTPSITRVRQIRSAKVLRSASHSGRKNPTRLTRSRTWASSRRRQVASVGESPSASSTSEMPAPCLADGLADRRLPHDRLPRVEQRGDHEQRDRQHQAADAVQPRDGQEPDDDPFTDRQQPEVDELGVRAPAPRCERRRLPGTRGAPTVVGLAEADHPGKLRRRTCQLVAPLIFGSVMAPSVDAPLLQDRGVGAVSHQLLDGCQHRVPPGRSSSGSRCRRERCRSWLPVTSNWPLDCLAAYSATGESASTASARPLDSARLAPLWSG